MMRFPLITASQRQLNSIQRYAFKNDKLLCLRDKYGKLLAVSKGLAGLQKAKSKDGFKYYQTITRLEPITGENNERITPEIIKNNYQKTVIVHDVYVQIYEGKIKHDDAYLNKMENYWYKNYEFYKANSHKYKTDDLINKRIARKTR